MVAYRPLAVNYVKSLPARVFFGHTFDWHTPNTYGGGQSTDGVQALKRKSDGEVINEKLWGTAMDIVIYRCTWSWVDWVWLHYFPPFCLIFLSSEQGLHHPAFLCVGMGCCEKYGMLIGFAVALKCFVGSNLSCICNFRLGKYIHHHWYA